MPAHAFRLASQAGRLLLRLSRQTAEPGLLNLLLVGDHHTVPHGHDGNDPVRIAGDEPRELAYAVGVGRSIASVEDAAVPDDVVRDEHTRGPKLFLDDRQGGGIARLINIAEDQVKRPGNL